MKIINVIKTGSWYLPLLEFMIFGHTLNAAPSPEQIRLPDGFKIELLYSVPRDDQGSWVAMCQDDKGYRNYYAQPERGSLQGGGTPGGLVMEHEFFESILVPQVMLYGFLGFEPTPDGIRLQPRLPRDWPELTVTRIHFRDHVFDLRVDETNVDVTFRRKGAGPVNIELPAGDRRVIQFHLPTDQ